MYDDPKVTAMREIRADDIRRHAADVRRLEGELHAAIRRRDAALVAAHGHRVDGGFSYTELGELAEISRGRVIQVVQGARGRRSA